MAIGHLNFVCETEELIFICILMNLYLNSQMWLAAIVLDSTVLKPNNPIMNKINSALFMSRKGKVTSN